MSQATATVYGQITSSDDGANIPSNDGFVVSGPFSLIISGGTTISATLERKSASGNWDTLPDDSDASTISGGVSLEVNNAREAHYRIAVTTATGTWDYDVEEY